MPGTRKRITSLTSKMKNPTFKVKHFGSRWFDYEITIPRENGETIISGSAVLNESVEIDIQEKNDL